MKPNFNFVKTFGGSLGLFRYIRWGDGSQMNQVIMSILAVFPTFSMGFVIGWVSPALPLLQDPNGPLKEAITEKQVSWMASVTFLVAVPMMLTGGLIADAIGRKKSLMIASTSLAMCWLIKIIWMQCDAIIIGRAVSGIGNALCYVIGPIYTKEMSDDNIRGAMCSLLVLAQNLGFLAASIIGDMIPFTTVLWVSFLIPVIHMAIFINAPETPSYLVKKGRLEEATEVLAWLRCKNNDDKGVVEDINKLAAEDSANNASGKNVFKYLLDDKTAQKAFAICALALFIQETCGYLILLTYASEVFEKTEVGSTLSPNQQSMVMGTVQLMGSALASCVVESSGRKRLLIATSALTGVGMFSLACCFYAEALGRQPPGALVVCSMCLAIFCTAAGFQPIPFVLLAEMFNFKLRGVVSSACIALTAISDFIQTQSYESLSKAIGIYGVFWIFSIVCFIGTVLTVFFVPETKNKSLSDIYDAIDRKRRKDIEGEANF